MWRRDTTSVLATLTWIAFLLANIQIGDACSCYRRHPQEHYCESDFVILARVKWERKHNDTIRYKVRVRKEYKMSEKALVALKSGQLLTPAEDAFCGVQLTVGEIYVLSGRVNSLRAEINLCNLYMPWKSLTKRQRRGFKAIYKQGCTCRIDTCRYKKCAKKLDSCLMNSNTMQCHIKEGVCMRQRNRRCNWTRNRMLTGCLKENPLTISRWSG